MSPLPTTIVDVLRARASVDGDTVGYRFLVDGDVDGPVAAATWAEVERDARAIAARLQAAGAKGERVLLPLPPGLDYVTALFGTLFAGAVAVPVYPPHPARLERDLPRLSRVAHDCGARFLIAPRAGLAGRGPDLAAALHARDPGLRIDSLDLAAVDPADATRWRAPDLRADDLAFLQYTSGSTGDPKGVMVTHGNLLDNTGRIGAGMGPEHGRVGVIWLPPYHDMGLIGGILGPAHTACPVVLLSPMAFLQRPARWLEAISRFRGTVSAAPDFAYALCCRKIGPDARARLDLSSWNVAFDGAERVRPETLDRFEALFAECGLRPGVLRPCYGLAEGTLVVTGDRPGPAPRVLADAAALADRRVVPLPGGHDGRLLVASGVPGPGQDLAIVDTDGRRLPEDAVGEIWVRGPSVAAGYWGQPEATEGAFGARLASAAEGCEERWLRTGDLGFLRGGALFVCGREKDLVVIRGQNHHPPDIEATVEGAHPAVRPGAVAVFAVERDGEEGVAVVAEIERTDAYGPILEAIRVAVAGAHDLDADVALVSPGRLPRTTSGKLRRGACREELEAGRLPVLARSAAPATATPPHTAPHTPSLAPEPRCPLYPRLDEAVARLDARGTTYQFDIERDIAWDRIDEPGDAIPVGMAEHLGIDVAAIRRVPGAWDVYQWAAAVFQCDAFVELEEQVLGFLHDEAADLGGNRSLALLDVEERKHIALFTRYADHLRARRPDLADAYTRHFGPALQRVRPLPSRVGDPLEHHYATWVKLAFFEEYTIWYHERLRAEADSVQPAWLTAHAAHAREEVQHVATDHAWLAALDLDEPRRAELSRKLFGEVVHILFALVTEVDVYHGFVRELFPAVGALPVAPWKRAPMMNSVVKSRSFRKTREALPYFGQLFEDASHAVGGVVRGAAAAGVQRGRVADADAIRAWVRAWLGRTLRRPEAAVDPAADFRQLGLDSVSAISLSGDLEAWLGCRLSPTLVYEYPSVDALALHVARGLVGANAEPGRPADEAEQSDAPSARQHRLLALEEAWPGQVLDHITTVYTIDGPLEADELEAALHALAARHPALRTRFSGDGGAFRQRVDPDAHIPVTFSTTRDLLSAARRRAAILDRTPFDPERDPLLRAELLRAAPDRHALVLSMHHVVTDGWSMATLMRDLAALLSGPRLAPLETDPLRIAQAEAGLVRSDEGARRLRFWREKLHGHPSLDRPGRGPVFRGGSAQRRFTHAEVAAWQAIGARHDASLYLTLLAALHVALARLHGETDLLVHTHLFDRPRTEQRDVVGYLVNLLTLRTSLAGVSGVAEVLPRVRATWLEALTNELPVDHLVRTLFPDRYARCWMPAPLAFNLIPWRYEGLAAGDRALRRLEEALPTPSFLYFDQMFLVHLGGEGATFTLWFDQDVITDAAAASLLDTVATVLAESVPATLPGTDVEASDARDSDA